MDGVTEGNLLYNDTIFRKSIEISSYRSDKQEVRIQINIPQDIVIWINRFLTYRWTTYNLNFCENIKST